MRSARGIVWMLAAAAWLPACERSYVEGRATDVRGEALPGVIVRVGSAPAKELTDGLGRYRVAVPAGAERLEFSKTGYSSAELAIDGPTRAAADVSLWPLPLNPGVYLVENLRFVGMTWAAPKPFDASDGTQAVGAVLPKDLRDATSEPFIVAYRTARYNARLSRLTPAETKSGGQESSATMWVEAGTMAAAFEPVDVPEGQLQRLQVGRPLEPGVYGVHWGAMSGYTTLDTRVFLFRVPEPLATEPLVAEAMVAVPKPGEPAAGEHSEPPAAAGQVIEPADQAAPVLPNP